MPVELTASTELVQAIGDEQFAEHLALFNATIVGARPADPVGAWIIYTLDVPGAPADAVRVEPTFGTHQDSETRTPFVYRLDWYDHAGSCVRTDTTF